MNSTSASRFTVQRESNESSSTSRAVSVASVSSTTSTTSSWIDTQIDLNHVLYRMKKGDASRSIKDIRVLSTFRTPIMIQGLLENLSTTTVSAAASVKSLALVGVQIKLEYAEQLAAAMASPTTVLSRLQLCRVLPESVAVISRAIAATETLRELRLTFHYDLSLDEIRMLTDALAVNTSIRTLKVYCVDFCEAGMELLADAVCKNTSITDLRLTSCNLKNVGSLVAAIQESNRIEQLDLSRNCISDSAALATLLNTPSIVYLCLSQNNLGLLGSDLGPVDDALRSNTTLERLHLDMNPISQDFAETLEAALEGNHTLIRLGLLTRTLSCQKTNKVCHAVQLNEAGRGCLRQVSTSAIALLPTLLGRVTGEPHLVYGLLKQRPEFMMQTN